jgi:hypothetical protein
MLIGTNYTQVAPDFELFEYDEDEEEIFEAFGDGAWMDEDEEWDKI